MTNTLLEQKLVTLVEDIEVAISNIEPGRDLHDLVSQTIKAANYLSNEKSRTIDSYLALLDIINEIDKYSNMDLRNSFFDFDKKFNDPEMQAKFAVLIAKIIDELFLKINSLGQPAI